MRRAPPRSKRTDTLFPLTTLVRSEGDVERARGGAHVGIAFERDEIVVSQHLVPDILEPLPGIAHPVGRHWRDRLDARITLYLRRNAEVAHAVLHCRAARRAVCAMIPGSRSSGRWRAMAHRSEEHTSELQSLMRISYAVFCLKKKNKKQKHTTTGRHLQHRTT